MTEAPPEAAGTGWYQRTWLWVAAGTLSGVLTVTAFMVVLSATDTDPDAGLLGALPLGIPPVLFLAGALVAKRVWARGLLWAATVIVLAVAVSMASGFHSDLEVYSLMGCELILADDGEFYELDPVSCEYYWSDFERDRSRNNLVLGVVWTTMLGALLVFRRRFQSAEPLATNPLLLQVPGWILVAIGSYGVLVYAESALWYVQRFAALLIALGLVGLMLVASGGRMRQRAAAPRADTADPPAWRDPQALQAAAGLAAPWLWLFLLRLMVRVIPYERSGFGEPATTGETAVSWVALGVPFAVIAYATFRRWWWFVSGLAAGVLIFGVASGLFSP